MISEDNLNRRRAFESLVRIGIGSELIYPIIAVFLVLAGAVRSLFSKTFDALGAKPTLLKLPVCLALMRFGKY